MADLFGNLFETVEDRSVRRAYAVLRGEIDGPLRPTAAQTALLRVLADKRGIARAVSASRLAEICSSNDRAIRSDVHELRELFGVPIGSSRSQDGGGYYLIATKEELFDTARPFLRQATSELRLVRAICAPHELAELEGQMRLQDERQVA